MVTVWFVTIAGRRTFGEALLFVIDENRKIAEGRERKKFWAAARK